MKHCIEYHFDRNIAGYVISMPEFIDLDTIEQWINSFEQELNTLTANQRLIMLVDTNQHEFESVQCLKRLRDFFTGNTVIKANGLRVAFVQPTEYRMPNIKSESEAYFSSRDAVYAWLRAKST